MSDVLDAYKNPDYTGENRCTPCTAVNVAIGALLAKVASSRSRLAGAVAFGLALLIIYLRGYLVPGTPTLTKRHLPDEVLVLFDEDGRPGARNELPDEDETPGEDGVEEVPEGTPDVVLLEFGAIEPCDGRDDLCLEAAFETAWVDALDGFETDEARREGLAAMLDVDRTDVEIGRRKNFVEATVDGTQVSNWPSEAALVADLAADDAMAGFDSWTAMPAGRRLMTLKGLRMFLETCPHCGGDVSQAEGSVESCCRSWDVIAFECGDCGDRLLEVDPPRERESGSQRIDPGFTR